MSIKYELLDQVVNFAAINSDDIKVKVGACVVGKNNYFGTNRFVTIPEGYTKDQLLADRDLKLKYITHAEVDAITNAGSDTVGATVYVNYTPCIDCAKKLVDAGVSCVVVKNCDDAAVAARWQDSWDLSIAHLNNNGVKVEVA